MYTNKVVLITGASCGIGATTAELFAKEGANLALVGRNEIKLKEVASICEGLGATTVTITADLTNDKDVKAIVEKTIEKFDKLNVLVNNAGIFRFGSVLDGKLIEDFNEVFMTNLRSVVLLTTLATPYLVKTKGNIVNISSVLGSSMLGKPVSMAYCMSKAALNHFTRGTALELFPFGVRVNTVSPGPTRTDIIKKTGTELPLEIIQDFYTQRTISEPKDVGDLIIFVASDKAKSITGVDYAVDNGALLKY